MQAAPKRFVYLLKSRGSGSLYVGVTSDVDKRLAAHNAGQNRSTASDRPWELILTMAFRTEAEALRFERYLKTGSGWAFVHRRLIG